MHIPTANQQLNATRLLAGQSFSLSTAQIAPPCWSLLWRIKREYVGYILSISFSKYCSLEVMSFILNSICNKITKIDFQMTNQRKIKTSCDSLSKGLTKTMVAQFYSHSLLIIWSQSSHEQHRTLHSCPTKIKTRWLHVTMTIHIISKISTVV
jgi:hypothetical protein